MCRLLPKVDGFEKFKIMMVRLDQMMEKDKKTILVSAVIAFLIGSESHFSLANGIVKLEGCDNLLSLKRLSDKCLQVSSLTRIQGYDGLSNKMSEEKYVVFVFW